MLGKLAACSTLDRARAKADAAAGPFVRGVVVYDANGDYPYRVHGVPGRGAVPASLVGLPVVYVATGLDGSVGEQLVLDLGAAA